MVIVFAERGEYDDYQVIIGGVADESKALAACRVLADKIAKQRMSENSVYECAIRMAKPEELKNRQTLLRRMEPWSDKPSEELLSLDSLVITEEITEAYALSRGWKPHAPAELKPANEYDWIVTFMPAVDIGLEVL
jgi:hypothetical protein